MTGEKGVKSVEVEGFGVSYDRYIMFLHQQLLVEELGLKRVLEMPSFGAKAASSLYSLGFARGGCQVTITDLDIKMKEYWQELKMNDLLKISKVSDYSQTDFKDNEFDLTWNFVTFTSLNNQDAYIREMSRVSNGYVMLISCNNFQAGYPWHRILHSMFGFLWNHGDTHYNYIGNVKRLMRKIGLKIYEYGTIDSPPWPDPVGFRDVRLHRKVNEKLELDWVVPVVDYIKKDNFPLWMKILRLYDLTLRKGYWKLPFSHLFYVIGKKES